MTLQHAAFWTNRSRASLTKLYQRGVLKSCGRDDRGALLFEFQELCKLGAMRQTITGRPSELLAT